MRQEPSEAWVRSPFRGDATATPAPNPWLASTDAFNAASNAWTCGSTFGPAGGVSDTVAVRGVVPVAATVVRAALLNQYRNDVTSADADVNVNDPAVGVAGFHDPAGYAADDTLTAAGGVVSTITFCHAVAADTPPAVFTAWTCQR